MKIVEVTRVTPFSNSPNSPSEFSLPLTFYDLFWFKLPPVERLFFYQLDDLTPAYFNSEILPKLKQSLSLTLLHYLPLAGNLKWPSDSPKPIILYTPNDGVSVTVAESNADLDLLSSNGIYEAAELRPLTPELITSDDSASTIALQVTLFPNKGFCIGITAHHAVLDGQTTTLFLKSWAYICKQGNIYENSPLPSNLTPFFDRSVIRDPNGVDMLYLNQWLAALGSVNSDSNINKISFKALPELADKAEAPSLVRATFEISGEYIKRLRERVLLSQYFSDGTAKQLHLSTFVLTLAYITTCIIKARGGDGDRLVGAGFTIDCRPRLNPPVPENYFGNCNVGAATMMKARDLFGENGFVFAVQKVSDKVKESLEKGVLQGIENKLASLFELRKDLSKSARLITVAGSPRFEVYGCDFGWGKPLKVVVVSIGSKGISLAESRDGSRGVEVGLALKKHEMDNFSSLFLSDV
ncbi:Transferase [Corchorus olitorius]|uniref:Transferase n=1 Tax=Corchorus olitorius TaxID=93759 RepID=A0A1R3FXS5_9ROSI|nr:Transferase [Corchorus olitorius]